MEQNETKKETRGGARAGAGRKAKADRVCRIGFAITAKAKANLEKYASAKGISLADATVEILEALSD